MSDQKNWKKTFFEFNRDERQMPFIIDEHFKRLQSEVHLESTETQDFRDKESENDVGLKRGFDVLAHQMPTAEVGDD